MKTTSFREAEAGALAGMTVAERARFEAAQDEEEVRLQLAELVYHARMSAGLTQTALAQRMGTKQTVISAIETGAQMPTVPMLGRIARGLNLHLSINMTTADSPDGSRLSITSAELIRCAMAKELGITYP